MSEFDLAVSTDDALGSLGRRAYDLVITDVQRGTEDDAGIQMLGHFRTWEIRLPVIIFAARFDPTLGIDPMIFGYANRYDELIHLVIDVMERTRID